MIERAEVGRIRQSLEKADFLQGAGLGGSVPVPLETLRKLYNMALAVMDAPVAMLCTDSESCDGEEIVEVLPLTAEGDVAVQAMHRKRVRLVVAGEG